MSDKKIVVCEDCEHWFPSKSEKPRCSECGSRKVSNLEMLAPSVHSRIIGKILLEVTENK